MLENSGKRYKTDYIQAHSLVLSGMSTPTYPSTTPPYKTSMEAPRRISSVSALQGLIAISCGVYAVVVNNLDTRDPSNGDRVADGLYYGLTVLFSMDAFIGLAACCSGIHSAYNWNCRTAYYHFVFTLYTIFCDTLEFVVSIYVVLKFQDPNAWSVQLGAIVFSLITFLIRLWCIRMSKEWQSLLHQRQALRIDPLDNSLPGSFNFDSMPRSTANTTCSSIVN